MLRFRLHMKFASQACAEAATVLRSLAGPVRAESGCLSTQVMMEDGDRCGLIWVEEWNDIEDFERHLRSQSFRQILAVIELADRPPEVEIDDVSSRRGFELVTEILGQAPPEDTLCETG